MRPANSMTTSASWWAAGALVLNAFVWGVSWWPFRQLQSVGLHPLWATTIIYTLCALLVGLTQRGAWREVLRHPALWVLVLASGTTNAAFNWAVTVGDVVRVVLLFYLMPLWAVLLARALLSEPITLSAMARVVLGLVGAGIVLTADTSTTAAAGAAPWHAGFSWLDALALLGGLSFALNNVMLRHQSARSASARTLAMFVGGALLAGVAALSLSASGVVPNPPAPAVGWLVGVMALGVFFLVGNMALQVGASRLPAQATSVIMLTEVVFASGSAWLLGATQLNAQLLIGGAFIMLAAVLAAMQR